MKNKLGKLFGAAVLTVGVVLGTSDMIGFATNLPEHFNFKAADETSLCEQKLANGQPCSLSEQQVLSRHKSAEIVVQSGVRHVVLDGIVIMSGLALLKKRKKNGPEF
ncbi:MAG: hypothetical protein HY052_04880 [Proteobacteria bacterium]|nr:hypothetical protein [Pseudomonadota bacterium]